MANFPEHFSSMPIAADRSMSGRSLPDCDSGMHRPDECFTWNDNYVQLPNLCLAWSFGALWHYFQSTGKANAEFLQNLMTRFRP